MEKSKLIIGLDPSMSTGIVVMDSAGKVYDAREWQLTNRSLSTDKEVLEYGRQIVDAIKDDMIVSVEGFAYSATGSAVSFQYGIGFAIRFALIDRGIPYYEPTPSELKKFVTGKGNSKKEIMIKEVFKRWGYEHPSNNVIDAYALAQFARHREGLI